MCAYPTWNFQTYYPKPTKLFNLALLFYTLDIWQDGEKGEGKDQESIQSSTAPDPGHHMVKWQKHKKTSHTRERRGQSFPSLVPSPWSTYLGSGIG